MKIIEGKISQFCLNCTETEASKDSATLTWPGSIWVKLASKGNTKKKAFSFYFQTGRNVHSRSSKALAKFLCLLIVLYGWNTSKMMILVFFCVCNSIFHKGPFNFVQLSHCLICLIDNIWVLFNWAKGNVKIGLP